MANIIQLALGTAAAYGAYRSISDQLKIPQNIKQNPNNNVMSSLGHLTFAWGATVFLLGYQILTDDRYDGIMI